MPIVKKYLLLTALFTGLYGAHSASPTPVQAKQHPAIGMWEWKTDSSTFRVRLQPVDKVRMPNNKLYQAIVGQYSYAKQGVVLEETFSPTTQKYTMPFGLVLAPDSTHLDILFQDKTKHNHLRAVLRLLPGQDDKLLWKQTGLLETIMINETPAPAKFKLPATFVLTRVE